jgi:hypothetical protein
MKKSLGLVTLTLVASSCGGKSDQEKFADSYCAEVAKCCGQAGLPADGKMCHQWMLFASAGSTFSAPAGDACLADMRSQVSAGTFCTDLNSTGSACDAVFTSKGGNKKPGETCSFDSDCAKSTQGDVVCANVFVGSSSIAKCQVQIPGKAGDSPCVGTKDGDVTSYDSSNATDVLAQGYICDVANGVSCQNGTCVALAGLGASCVSPIDCVRTAYCSFPGYVCTAKVAAGGACTGIAGSECVDSAYCDTTALHCTAKLASGAACTSSAQCQSDYCSNGTCQGSSVIGLSLLCGS